MDVNQTNPQAVNSTDVNPQLVQLARRVFGAGRRILITGGTGFVGSCLAQVLHDADLQVTITGRSRFRVRSDGQFVAADITNQQQVEKLCQNQEFVFHTAALTSPWGGLPEHRKTNVDGTQHVVDACATHRVRRLVHVSSTAIFFQFEDQCIDDDTPLPDQFCCHYAQSKAEAEHVVRAAMKSGLNSYIVRARAVFGPGDNALLPRLLKAAERGKLRQIGEGKNLCDLTYIDNLLAGLILAADPNRPQGTCAITNEEPVNLWDVLHRVLHETVPNHNSDRRISYPVARRVAHAIELKHRLLGTRGEPAITRYGVGLLAFQQTFSSSAARDQLAYSPIVPMDEAIDRTIQSLKPRAPGDSSSASQTVHAQHSRSAAVSNGARVSVKFFSTGFIEFPRHYAERGATKSKTRFHATVALIQHPEHGPILFDAGYTPRFFDATQRWPYRLYRWATKVITRSEWEPAAWLKREGIRPDELKLLMISHFHGDHICGLEAFPNAEFLTLGKTWESARDRYGLAALKRAILPDLMPSDFADRVHTIHEMHSGGVGPFLRCHDLFRDGSIRLFDLDGHADGQMGVLLNAGDKQYFLAADAFWTRMEIENGLEATGSFRMIADNYGAAAKTRQAICQLAKQFPAIEFVCTHCPEFAREQGFDAALEEASQSSSIPTSDVI